MNVRFFACTSCFISLAGLCLMIRGTQSVAQVSGEGAVKQMAKGVVYHDTNGDKTFDAGDKPLADIRVSNGTQIVRTNELGQYELPIDEDDILFVIKPSGWKTPVNEQQLPRFFYVHKPHGSPNSKFAGVAPTGPLPASVDFPLYPNEEPEHFKAIMFGDPQPRNVDEVEFVAHDVIEELIGTDASFGVTLGDIVFDDLSVFDAENQAIALLGIPWYNVIGNHDINLDSRTRQNLNETFERIYGPSYYSFDHGPVHFLVLDNIDWIVNETTGKASYKGGLGEEQMEFIKTDLSLIPEDQLVVLMMHIPLTEVNDRHGLYRLIEQRPFCMSISGHTHTHEHRYITHEDGWRGPEPHHHVVNVTVSGSWWSGAPDDRGIPHSMMSDGAPNGYTIFTFDGQKYSLDFKAAGRPADYQMHIEAPDQVAQSATAETTIWVNVFNGSERSKVEMRCGEAEWVQLEKADSVDPHFQRVYTYESQILSTYKPWRELPKPHRSTHLWKGNLPANLSVGTHMIEVKTVDNEGRTFEEQRIIRIETEGKAE